MFVVVLAISSFFVVTAQKADFNGTWKLDRTKSTLAEYTPILTRIEIRIKRRLTFD